MGHFAFFSLARGWESSDLNLQGPVAQSLVSANHWLRGVKNYRLPWYLTLVSANHASSNPGQGDGNLDAKKRMGNLHVKP